VDSSRLGRLLDRVAIWARRQPSRRWTALILLGLVSAASLGARLWHLGTPGEDRPHNGFVFDETYYVNAARVVAGLPVPPGDTYSGASPPGTDPNGEHPQLGKLIISAGLRLLGDNGWGWRLTAVLFGSASILLIHWLVRTAGGSRWLALGAASLAAIENLFMVSSRIAVLDIYCVPFMLAGTALYLRRHPVLAGLLFGIGSCIKEFCLFGLFVVLIIELARALARWWERRRDRSATPVEDGARGSPWRHWVRAVLPAVTVVAVTGITFVSLLEVLDRTLVPYHGGAVVSAGQAALCDRVGPWSHACNHIAFMNDYARHLTGIKDIAAPPWWFWADLNPINYFTSTHTETVAGAVVAVDPIVSFAGFINPVILLLAVPAFLANLYWAVRRRDTLSFLVCAWYIATWLPGELANLVGDRTTYLYYMVVTLPGVFIGVARLAGDRRVPRVVLGIWIGLVIAAFLVLYPFRTFSGT
jgi:4-amino-4-deoxy-L-arabinose transferase-like glycosyltransferase